MQEIRIQDVAEIRIGQAEDRKAGTGVTVLICDKGMAAGLDVRGGGPASRESQILNPLMAAQVIHAVVLGGGSAFGLDAAGGVMQYLEEKDIGFDVGVTKVPLVSQADIFDLGIGDAKVRPDKAMGYEAAKNSEDSGNYQDGCHGAGTGATVGKVRLGQSAMKSGIGSYAVQLGELKVGAVVVVNALGDVYDWKNGKEVAGLVKLDRTGLEPSEEVLYTMLEARENKFVGNTTIAAILTNASFPKANLCKIAGMAHDGMARSIRPVHTSMDGDSIFALSAGTVKADQDVVGVLAANVLSEAILRAVKTAEPMFGLPAASDFEEA